MEAKRIIILLFTIAGLHRLSCAQLSGGLEIYNRLESRLNALNSSLTQQQKQIDVIIADLVIQQLTHEDDIKTLKNQLKSAQEKLSSLEKLSKETSDTAAFNAAQLLSTEIQVLELSSRMDKLNATNQLWRSNFQVVNRTFSELRKKFVFVNAPVFPGIKAS